MAPVATFAVPCFNAGSHLRPLLESLLAQSRQDFELLLVDDASTDGSVAMAREVAGDRVAVHVNHERLGLAANWNRCAELVDTPLFCLAHMDDVYEPEYLERMVGALEAQPGAALAHCRGVAIDAAGESVDEPAESYKDKFWTRLSTDRAATFQLLFRGNFIMCPSALYRTTAWRELGGVDPDLRFAPDWKLWFAALLAGYDLAAVPQRLLRYRRHDASATVDQSRTLRRYREELEVLDWAARRGVPAGLIDARAAERRDAVRNNLLYDAYRDLRSSRGSGSDAARAKLEFLRRHAPALARDPVVRLFSRLIGLGVVGRGLLGLGLRAAMLRARI